MNVFFSTFLWVKVKPLKFDKSITLFSGLTFDDLYEANLLADKYSETSKENYPLESKLAVDEKTLL